LDILEILGGSANSKPKFSIGKISKNLLQKNLTMWAWGLLGKGYFAAEENVDEI
jgi:hypothetical protein